MNEVPKSVRSLLTACVTALIVWQEEQPICSSANERYRNAYKLRDEILSELNRGKEPIDDSRDKKTECYSCVHKETVPGNCHIRCGKPDEFMTGSQHGISKGWFFYPLLFDPVWKKRLCNNYKPNTANVPDVPTKSPGQ